MSASKSRLNIRRRLSLLTGSSLALAFTVGAASALSLAPSQARAADECGPSTGTQVCSGTHPSITYTTTGNLTLRLQGDLVVTTGGLAVTGAGTNSVTISRSPDGAGDPSLTSTSGAGLRVSRATLGGNISVNLSDTNNDSADTPLAIAGTSAGVQLSNMGTSTTALTTTNGTIAASAGAGIEVGTSGTGALTVTNGAAVTGTTAAILVTGGAAATITNSATGALNGVVTMNNTGNSSFTNNGGWVFTGASLLGAGNTTLSNTAVGTIATSEVSSIDFAAGGDTFTNAGWLIVDGVLALNGLETWNNSGVVVFGGADRNASDGQANDRIVHGGTFNGTGRSHLLMDVDFAASQADCTAAVTADCLDLRGGTSAGATNLVVTTVAPGTAERIVLVDVGGAGTSAAGHFTLDGGVVDGGLFLYSLQYDATSKQHALVADDLSGGGLALALVGRATSEPWRTATGMWHDRQADMRNALAVHAQGYAPGAWLKVAGGFVDEERRDASPGGAEFDTSYAQQTTAVVGGVDVIRIIREDSVWVLGLTAGKIDSSVDYIADPTVLDMEGYSVGAYASVLAGPVFFDAIVNSTDLDLTYAAFGDAFNGTARSIGYQLEGGYRLFRINEDGAWFEPLAALNYVRTDVDGLELGDVSARFDDASSLRAALGARIGGDFVMDALTASLSVTGRLWRGIDGDNTASLSGVQTDYELVDEGMDSLGDLGLAVSLFTLGNRLSAHLAYNLIFKDDYQNTSASFGLRYNW